MRKLRFFIPMVLFLGSAPALTETAVSQYRGEKSKLIQKEVRQRNILSDLYGIKMQMKRVNKEKSKALTKFNKVQIKFEKLNQIVEEIEARIRVQKIEIRKRIVFMAKFQDLSFLKLLFSSQTPIELDRNLRLLKLLTEKDFSSLKNYFKDVHTLIVKRDQLRKEREELADLKNAVLDKERELSESKEKKTEMLGEIATQKALLFVKLKQLRLKTMPESEEKSKAQAFYEIILKPLLFEEKGELKAPVLGKIIQKYGYYHDPVYQTKLIHKGVFIQADIDTNVSSIYDGDISFRGVIPGFGKTVIVSHGDHYYSVYSHLDEFLVRHGDKVAKDQVIGRTGNTHPFFGKGLYFEVRHFSEPTDPLEWINLKEFNSGAKHAAL